MKAKKFLACLCLKVVVSLCALAPSASLWAKELPDYLSLDCFRTGATLQDIHINRAICDAEATDPASAGRYKYKHGVYRPVLDRDYIDYPKMKADMTKCPPGSDYYICLGVREDQR